MDGISVEDYAFVGGPCILSSRWCYPPGSVSERSERAGKQFVVASSGIVASSWFMHLYFLIQHLYFLIRTLSYGDGPFREFGGYLNVRGAHFLAVIAEVTCLLRDPNARSASLLTHPWLMSISK
jgi:hypothetical protein